MAETCPYKLFGSIQCQDVPSNRAVRAFVEKHIERWIAGHETSVFTNEPSDPNAGRREVFHTISLRRQGPGHHFVCHVRLKFPTGSWSGSSFGEGLHQTVLRAVQNLSPVLPPPQPKTATGTRIPKLLHSAA
jgi:hypothetical protein